MKWFVYLLSLAMCALWMPVVPVAASSVVTGQTTEYTVSTTSVVVVSAPAFSAAAVPAFACGSDADKVGNWLNQTRCADLPLPVVVAHSDAFQLAVVDTPLVASLAVHYPEATLQPVAVHGAPVPAPVVAESSSVAVIATPRHGGQPSFGVFSEPRTQLISVAGQRPVAVLLRC